MVSQIGGLNSRIPNLQFWGKEKIMCTPVLGITGYRAFWLISMKFKEEMYFDSVKHYLLLYGFVQ